MDALGKELILDLHECNDEIFTRGPIAIYMKHLCVLIEMEPRHLFWWDQYNDPECFMPPHMDGTSAVQFIKTSSVVLHTFDEAKKVYINIFSCKDFSERHAMTFSAKYFGGKVANYTVVERI